LAKSDTLLSAVKVILSEDQKVSFIKCNTFACCRIEEALTSTSGMMTKCKYCCCFQVALVFQSLLAFQTVLMFKTPLAFQTLLAFQSLSVFQTLSVCQTVIDVSNSISSSKPISVSNSFSVSNCNWCFKLY